MRAAVLCAAFLECLTAKPLEDHTFDDNVVYSHRSTMTSPSASPLREGHAGRQDPLQLPFITDELELRVHSRHQGSLLPNGSAPARNLLFTNAPAEFSVAGADPVDTDPQPAVAVLAAGGVVVVWHEGGNIVGRRIDADGQLMGAGTFAVNDNTVGVQSMVTVAGLATGGFCAVWHSDVAHQLHARIFSDDGTPRAASSVVVAYSVGKYDNPTTPALCTLEQTDGYVALSYAATDTSVSKTAILFLRLDKNGNAVGTAVAASQGILKYNLQLPQCVGLTGGNFVVIWEQSTDVSGPKGQDVYFRVFNGSDGTAVTASNVGTSWTPFGDTRFPTVGAMRDDTFVLVGEVRAASGTTAGSGNLAFQAYNNDGSLSGSPALATNYGSGNTVPQATFGFAGMFYALIWTWENTVGSCDVMMRVFKVDKTAITPTMVVNSESTCSSTAMPPKRRVAAVALQNDQLRFAVVWWGVKNGVWDLFAQTVVGDCPWIIGATAPASTPDGLVMCFDGHYCNWSTDPNQYACCSAHNGRKYCPASNPHMCTNLGCAGNTDVCCSLPGTNACGGATYGGLRVTCEFGLFTCANTDGTISTDRKCLCALATCFVGQLCTVTGDAGLCTNVAECGQADGTASNTVECTCGSAACAPGQICAGATNSCTNVVGCVNTIGVVATTMECNCSNNAVCAAHTLCTVNSGVGACSAKTTCSNVDATVPVVRDCVCSVSAVCDFNQLCIAKSNTCQDVASCVNTDGTDATSIACNCGANAALCNGGLLCTVSGTTGVCSAMVVCVNTDGTDSTLKECLCGENATCKMGQLCTQTGNRGVCVDVVTCVNTNGTDSTSKECSCGNATCEMGQLCTRTGNSGACANVVACVNTDASNSTSKECLCGHNARCKMGQLCTTTGNSGVCSEVIACGDTTGVDSTSHECSCGNNATCESGQLCTVAGNSGVCTNVVACVNVNGTVSTMKECMCGNIATCKKGHLCTQTDYSGVCTNVVPCENTSGTVSTMKECFCGTAATCEKGQLCSQTSNSGMCTNVMSCATTNGTVATERQCLCGHDATCNAGQFCAMAENSGTCAMVRLCEHSDGTVSSPTACLCGSNVICEQGQLCAALGTTEICSNVAACVNQEGTATTDKECLCGDNASCTKAELCTATGNHGACTRAAPCVHTDGTKSTAQECACGNDTTCGRGQFCRMLAHGGTCSNVIGCVHADGYNSTTEECACGAHTQCEAGQTCTAATSTCSALPFCRNTNGTVSSITKCLCGSAGSTCEADQLCTVDSNAVSTCANVAKCEHTDGTVATAVECTCNGGPVRCAYGQLCNGGLGSGATCTHVTACVDQSGTMSTAMECICGAIDARNCARGQLCTAGGHVTCTDVSACRSMDGTAATSVECVCGAAVCAAGQACDGDGCGEPLVSADKSSDDEESPLFLVILVSAGAVLSIMLLFTAARRWRRSLRTAGEHDLNPVIPEEVHSRHELDVEPDKISLPSIEEEKAFAIPHLPRASTGPGCDFAIPSSPVAEILVSHSPSELEKSDAQLPVLLEDMKHRSPTAPPKSTKMELSDPTNLLRTLNSSDAHDEPADVEPTPEELS